MKTLIKSFRNLVLIICSLFWLSNVQAQPKGENIFIIHDAVGEPESTVVIYLEVVNEDQLYSFQIDLLLPLGFSYVSGSAWLNPAREYDHLINGSLLPGTNVLRILSFALSGASYMGNEGIIATFALNTPAQPGEYLLIPDSVILGDSFKNTLTGIIGGTIFITPGGRVPGDSNCDGVVNVIDVVISTNYILGTIPELFCFQNADLNDDLLVNVADAVGTINIILGSSYKAK